MAHHIGSSEAANRHPFHALEHLGGLNQATALMGGQVDLAGVAGDDHA